MSKNIDALRALITADEMLGKSRAKKKVKTDLYKQVCSFATNLVKDGFTAERLNRVLRSTSKMDATSFAYSKGKIVGIIYGKD